MADNKTIAFWCEKADGAGETATEFHVNLWHFANKKRTDFFEIGILTDEPRALSAIKIYVPFSLTGRDIQDLGPEFASTDLAQGIFNETLASTRPPNGKCVELKIENLVYCNVHIFSPDGAIIDSEELSLKPQDGGTLLTITQQALTTLARQSEGANRGYFRIRISPKTKGDRPFMTVIRPKDRAWNSGFDVIEYIDCRINEARTLPKSVETAAAGAPYGVAATSRVVFLAVVPVVSSVTSSHAAWHKSRLLENEIWQDYVPEGLEDGMVVYHWRKEFVGDTTKPLHGFSVFVKMQIRKSGLLIISLYLAMAFLLGVIGSMTASYFQILFNSSGA
jgi:hypothetical protein